MSEQPEITPTEARAEEDWLEDFYRRYQQERREEKKPKPRKRKKKTRPKIGFLGQRIR